MGSTIELFRRPPLLHVIRVRPVIPDVRRSMIAAQSGQDFGDFFGVACSHQETHQSRWSDAGEEILQIHSQDKIFADMRSRVRSD